MIGNKILPLQMSLTTAADDRKFIFHLQLDFDQHLTNKLKVIQVINYKCSARRLKLSSILFLYTKWRVYYLCTRKAWKKIYMKQE